MFPSESPNILTEDEQELLFLDGEPYLPIFVGSPTEMKIKGCINQLLYGSNTVRRFKRIPGILQMNIDEELSFKDLFR